MPMKIDLVTANSSIHHTQFNSMKFLKATQWMWLICRYVKCVSKSIMWKHSRKRNLLFIYVVSFVLSFERCVHFLSHISHSRIHFCQQQHFWCFLFVSLFVQLCFSRNVSRLISVYTRFNVVQRVRKPFSYIFRFLSFIFIFNFLLCAFPSSEFSNIRRPIKTNAQHEQQIYANKYIQE